MGNRKFTFLMREFIQLVNFSDLEFYEDKALVCIYNDLECRIEDGALIGLHGHIIILISLSQLSLDSIKAFSLNSDLNLIPDGRIILLNNDEYYLTRNFLIPEHTYQLQDYLNETIQLTRNLIKEFKIKCG